MLKVIAKKIGSNGGGVYVEEYEIVADPEAKTLRDEFAIAALMGAASRGILKPREAADYAYRIADEMMEARK
jgi:hypothetical protein